MTSRRREAAPGGATLETRNPADGTLVGSFPVHGEADVRAAVARAHEVSEWWRHQGFDGRARRLKA